MGLVAVGVEVLVVLLRRSCCCCVVWDGMSAVAFQMTTTPFEPAAAIQEISSSASTATVVVSLKPDEVTIDSFMTHREDHETSVMTTLTAAVDGVAVDAAVVLVAVLVLLLENASLS